MDAAFAALRRHARDLNMKLTDVATAVVTAGLDLTGD
jgi:AmiR/NasT family two-component response regulator